MTVDEYREAGRVLYSEFAAAVAEILRAAVTQHADLRLQSIQHRAKELASLETKIARSGAEVDASIDDIAKDIAGCRLIFYTNGDVYRFRNSGVLRENFDIDFNRSKMHYPQNSDAGAEFFISDNWS
jgi:ppGpp synthetase/RelA/SpoT-type nucleotidyltranferase